MFSTLVGFENWKFCPSVLREFALVDSSASIEDIYHQWFESKDGYEEGATLFKSVVKGFEGFYQEGQDIHWEIRESNYRLQMYDLWLRDPLLSEYSKPTPEIPKPILKARVRMLAEHTFYFLQFLGFEERFEESSQPSVHKTIFYTDAFFQNLPVLSAIFQELVHPTWIEALANDASNGFDNFSEIPDEFIIGVSELLALNGFLNPSPPSIECHHLSTALVIAYTRVMLQRESDEFWYHQGTRTTGPHTPHFDVFDFGYSCFHYSKHLSTEARTQLQFESVPIIGFRYPDIEAKCRPMKESLLPFLSEIQKKSPWLSEAAIYERR